MRCKHGEMFNPDLKFMCIIKYGLKDLTLEFKNKIIFT
jgi:hypothetical protein